MTQILKGVNLTDVFVNSAKYCAWVAEDGAKATIISVIQLASSEFGGAGGLLVTYRFD